MSHTKDLVDEVLNKIEEIQYIQKKYSFLKFCDYNNYNLREN